MSSILLVAAFLAATPGDTTVQPITSTEVKSPVSFRTGRELERAAHAAMRRWANPADDVAMPAAREFLVLYNELQRDTQLPRATREHLAQKIRTRLAALARLIRRQTATEEPWDRQRPEVIGKAAAGGVLAQWAGRQDQPQNAFGMPGSAPSDAGADLVELIQTTIAPASWERMGGPGTIRYWRPGRAIVVRNRDDIHDRIGKVLEQMNRLEQ